MFLRKIDAKSLLKKTHKKKKNSMNKKEEYFPCKKIFKNHSLYFHLKFLALIITNIHDLMDFTHTNILCILTISDGSNMFLEASTHCLQYIDLFE